MNYLVSDLLFYVFASLALISALLVILRRNPVHSAICLGICFVSAAAIMFQLDAQFLGVIQILVYTGAIMVLIVFVIMLLNLDHEKGFLKRPLPLICGLVIAGVFMGQLYGVIKSLPGAEQACAACDDDQECRLSTALKELYIGESEVTPDIPPAATQASTSKQIISRDFTAKISFKSSASVESGKNIISKTESTGEWQGKVITKDSEELKRILEYLRDDSTICPMPGKTVSSQPPIGHSPSIVLPEIDLQQISSTKGSSIAKSIEKGGFPDASLLGYRLFSKYNMELIIAGFALLAATVGSVVLTGGRPRNK